MSPAELQQVYEAQLAAACRPGAPGGRSVRLRMRSMLTAARTMPATALNEIGEAWVWSDLHLGHANIIRYADRPFDDSSDMDKTLLANWNATVGDDDVILCLGDVALGPAVGPHTWQHIREGPGRRKLLVFGNHDLNRAGALNVEGFDAVHSAMRLSGNPTLLFTHLPMYPVPSGCINVHGHIHGKPAPSVRHINVCVEQLDYRPVPLSRIVALAKRIESDRPPMGGTTLERMAAADC